MKTNSIIYKSFVPTVLKPQKDTKSEPTFKYKGYQRQYRWDKDDTFQDTSQTQSEASEETTSTQSESTQTITSIQSPSITSGTTIYKDPTINVGNMKDLLDRFNQAGISVRVTSGLRPGATTSNGSKSWHSEGWAIDITPGEGETWESLRTKLKSSPDLIKYMQDNQLGILDETNSDMLARTGGTGAHWHIGRDQSAIKGLEAILSAQKGTKLSWSNKKSNKLTNTILSNHYNQLPIILKGEKPLQPLTQEAMSYAPIVGDAIEASSIIGNLLDNNWKQALISAGLLVLPGNASKITKNLGFKFNKIPINDYIFTSTNKGPASIKLDKLEVDKNIKNTPSNLAERYNNGGANRINLPNLSKEIQNTEPLTGELEGLFTPRHSKQPSFNFPEQNNIPSFIFLSDKNTKLSEVGNNVSNKVITETQRRQLLDHEISHYIDQNYRPDFYNSKLDFVDGNDYQRKATEVGARVGQIKDAAGITDGSKVFTEQELKDLFTNYLNDPNNIDNGISNLKNAIKDWTKFTNWVNGNIPLINKVYKPMLFKNPNETETESDK